MFDRLRYEPRRAVLAGGGLVLLLVVAMVVAVVLHLDGGRSNASPASAGSTGLPAQATAGLSSTSSSLTTSTRNSAPANDVARWNAMPAVSPATSSNYPAISAAARADSTGYVRAFATELFTRDYRRSTRAELLAWAQSEDAPLRSPNYPTTDWTKVLVDSLSDLTWDSATDTPVPSDGAWLALRSESARDTVSDVKVEPDPQWEQRIANGYQPPDALTSVRDVSLTVTRHTDVAGRPSTTRFEVSLALQLGTATHDGYGVAATNNYIARQVG